MRRAKALLLAILAGYLAAYGLSCIPPHGENITAVNSITADTAGGEWETTVSATPWKGVYAYYLHWLAYLPAETERGKPQAFDALVKMPTPVKHFFLVRGSTPAKVEGKFSPYGLTGGDYRVWIKLAGFLMFLLTLSILASPRDYKSRKREEEDTSRFVRPAERGNFFLTEVD